MNAFAGVTRNKVKRNESMQSVDEIETKKRSKEETRTRNNSEEYLKVLTVFSVHFFGYFRA